MTRVASLYGKSPAELRKENDNLRALVRELADFVEREVGVDEPLVKERKHELLERARK